MNPYIPHTKKDIEEMLAVVGLPDVEALFSDIPKEVRRRFQPLGLPSRDEIWVSRYITGLSERSTGRNLVPFLGAGLYDHYVPAVVNHILSRSEFYTAYTPYQAEISQGTLTWMFEYQTMVCELTGMEVANASMYDGATALAEAVYMAVRTTGGKTVLVPKSLNPHVREVLSTYAWAAGLKLVDVPYNEEGRLFLSEIPDDTCALIVQEPNFFGVVEDLSGLKERIGKAFLIVYVNPIALGVLEPPGKFGADVVVGEGQVLGLPLSFGGPLLGFSPRKWSTSAACPEGFREEPWTPREKRATSWPSRPGSSTFAGNRLPPTSARIPPSAPWRPPCIWWPWGRRA
jgi:glycine dehydrogenase subunit 1